MLGRPGSGQTRRSRSKRRRSGRLVGLAAATGVFVALGLTPLAAVPAAHADIEDLFFDPVVEAAAQAFSAVDPDFTSVLDPGLDLDSVAAPALASIETTALTSATVPLHIYNTTEPLVNLSVSGGPEIPVVVDTGSNGLVMPWYDIGWDNLAWPTGWGFGAYSGGLDYFYVSMPGTVDFGDGLVTDPTAINAVLFAWPGSWSSPVWSLEQFLGTAGAKGVLGIAPDAVGPNTDVLPPTAFLPGDLGNGALIDMAGGKLVFGDNPFVDSNGDLIGNAVVVNGVADASLKVSIDGGPLQSVDHTIIDSGGVYGTIPSSLIPGAEVGAGLPAGTEISVYADDGTPLYSYTVDAANSPVVISGEVMNTGYYPFAHMPMYISYSPGSSVGATYFGGR